MMGYLNIFDIFCMGHVGQDFWTSKTSGFPVAELIYLE